MKKSFLKTVLLSAVVVLASKLNAHSQDYVVTLKGDTIPCKISGYFKYKCDNAADLDKLKHSRVRDFYIAKKRRLERVVFVNNGNGWILDLKAVIENGKISLYQSVENDPRNFDGSSNPSTVWYVSKGTDSVRALKTSAIFGATSRQSREDELGQLLMDNKEVYEKYIADEKFSFGQIRNIVHLYNTGAPLKN